MKLRRTEERSLRRRHAGLAGLALLTSLSGTGIAGAVVQPALRAGDAALLTPHVDPSNGSVRVPLEKNGCVASQAVLDEMGARAPLSFTTLADSYDLAPLYRSGDLGQGTTIALVEFSSFLGRDLLDFEHCEGLHAAVRSIPVDGGPGTLNRGAAGQLEADLDLEETVALAPRAKVLVFEGPEGSWQGILDTYRAAINSGADVVSTSWGSCEAHLPSTFIRSEAELFRRAAENGQSVVAAAGDSGSEDCYDGPGTSTGLAVDDPASQPDVTGVGGTTFVARSAPRDQAVWNQGRAVGAGGGGVSSHWAMPSYQILQAASVGASVQACPSSFGECRTVPDVAADAGTPVVFYCSVRPYCTGWSDYGGTSAAAPLWAAIFDLADASASCDGARVGFANPALYGIADGAHAGAAFSDVVSGDNDLGGSADYPARPGYDLASGLGTPVVGDGHDGHLLDLLCSGARQASLAVGSN